MPCCPKCGLVVNVKDPFCINCGTTLNSQGDVREKRVFHFTFPPNPSTNLINGILMGAGLTAFFIGLLLWSSLNANFWSQRDLLISQGLNPIESTGSLSDTVNLISLCAGEVIVSSCAVIYTSVFQFSKTVRTVLGKNELRTRVANGFLIGGVVSLSLTAQNTVYNSYPPFSSYPNTNEMTVGIFGTLLILTGILLTTISYLKSRNLATKV